jgi:hypothetical protein
MGEEERIEPRISRTKRMARKSGQIGGKMVLGEVGEVPGMGAEEMGGFGGDQIGQGIPDLGGGLNGDGFEDVEIVFVVRQKLPFPGDDVEIEQAIDAIRGVLGTDEAGKIAVMDGETLEAKDVGRLRGGDAADDPANDGRGHERAVGEEWEAGVGHEGSLACLSHTARAV